MSTSSIQGVITRIHDLAAELLGVESPEAWKIVAASMTEFTDLAVGLDQLLAEARNIEDGALTASAGDRRLARTLTKRQLVQRSAAANWDGPRDSWWLTDQGGMPMMPLANWGGGELDSSRPLRPLGTPRTRVDAHSGPSGWTLVEDSTTVSGAR
jgi:hypothetical protein